MKSRYSWNQADRQLQCYFITVHVSKWYLPYQHPRVLAFPPGCPTNRIPHRVPVQRSAARVKTGNSSLQSLHLRGQWKLEHRRREERWIESFLLIVLSRELGSVHFIVHWVYGPHQTCNKRSLNVSYRTEKSPEKEIPEGSFSLSCWGTLARSLQCWRVISLEGVIPYCTENPHTLTLNSGLCWKPPAVRMKMKS